MLKLVDRETYERCVCALPEHAKKNVRNALQPNRTTKSYTYDKFGYLVALQDDDGQYYVSSVYLFHL